MCRSSACRLKRTPKRAPLTLTVSGQQQTAAAVATTGLRSEWPAIEKPAATRLASGALGESGRLVHVLRARIGLVDFERHFAASELPRLFSDAVEQLAPDALAAVFRDNREIVDIDERTGVESRKADEARRDPDRPAFDVRQQDHRRRVSPETRDQLPHHIVRQWTAIAHRVFGVGADEADDCCLVIRPIEVCLDDGRASVQSESPDRCESVILIVVTTWPTWR